MIFTEVIEFWFKEISPSQHWKKDSEFDELIRKRFSEIHAAATAGELSSWRESPQGALAEVIVLDQFSRNMYRDEPRAFASDPLALILAQVAVARNFHKELNSSERAFLYMPLMHSESKLIHKQAVELMGHPEWGAGSMEFELKHKAIIDRFGRYPHRNSILNRKSTPEEIEFLKGPDSGF